MDDMLQELEVLHFGDGECITDDSWRAVERVVNSSLLPKLEFGFDIPPERKHFESFIPVVTCNLKALKIFVTKLKTNSDYRTKRKKIKSSFVVSLLTLCGEHSSESKWTNEETVSYCREITHLLCEILTCKDIGELLVGDRCFYDSEVHRLYKPLLTALRPKLLKDTWKSYPGAVACYCWSLFQVDRKHLGDYLGMIVPTALILTDDFIPENAATGIKCLSHIAENSTKTDLYCHADVIYSAVKQSLFHKEVYIVKAAVPCLINILDKIERNQMKDDYITEWSKYDETLELILQNLELCPKSDIKESYIENLPAFLESMPLSVVNWSSPLLTFFEHSLEMTGYSKPSFMRYSVSALKVFLKKTWPTIQHHCKRLLRMLLRFVVDVTDLLSDSANTKLSAYEKNIYTEAVKEAEECLLIIARCSPEQVKLLCPRIKEVELFNRHWQEIIQRVFISL